MFYELVKDKFALKTDDKLGSVHVYYLRHNVPIYDVPAGPKTPKNFPQIG